MKIGIDASRYTQSSATGVEWYSWHIINHLIELIAKEDDDVFLYSRHHLIYADQVIDLVKKSKGQFQNRVLNARKLWTLLRLSKEMRQNPPDILFVPSHVLPLSRPKISVITIHDTAFRHLRSAYSFFQYWYLIWSTKYAVKHANKIIVPSEATKKDLIEYFACPGRKIEVVYHGFVKPEIDEGQIDEQFEKSEVFKHFGITRKTKFLLFVGRLESKKNLERVVLAFEEFLREHAEFKLVLAGKRGTGFEEIYKIVKEKNLLSSVLMPGYITEEEKAVLMRHCQAFIFPSLYEGFGFPVLEAFYFEKPVLTSKHSSLPEVAGAAAHYVDPYSTEEIAAGMCKLVDDKQYSEKLVLSGQEQLKKFSWEKAAKQTLEIIKNV